MKFEKITKEDLSNFSKKMPPSKAILEFQDRIKELEPNDVGKFSLTKEDTIKSGAVKARILRASKLLGIPVVVKRYGNDVLFWVQPDAEPVAKEAPKEKTKGKK